MIHERLSGYEEAPFALSTGGHGTFRAMVTDAGIEYTLTYCRPRRDRVTGTHPLRRRRPDRWHQRVPVHQLGGPAGTQACPAAGEVTGTIVAADVSRPP